MRTVSVHLLLFYTSDDTWDAERKNDADDRSFSPYLSA